MAGNAPPTTKWQQPFDASLTDVFQVQADIAGRVAQALDVALGSQVQQQLAEKPTQNLAAYDAYLKGMEAYSLGSNTTTCARPRATLNRPSPWTPRSRRRGRGCRRPPRS